MKILSILICYGTGRTTPALAELTSFHAALRDGNHRDYLIGDNALAPGFLERLDEHTTLIGGDNALREFSGFERALQFVGPRLAEYDLLHLVTETFNTDYRHYLGLLTPKLLALAVEKNFCLGHIDGLPREVTLFGTRSRTWIRSCYLLVPRTAVQALGTFITSDGSDPFFSEDPQMPFSPHAPIDGQYQQFLRKWLTGDGKADGMATHRSPFCLSSETFSQFKAKVVAIVNEHGLSVRLRKLGFPTIDVEWLYDMLLERPPGKIDWQTPVEEILRHTGARRQRLGITPP